MPVDRYLTTLNKFMAGVGFTLGLYAGFITRDEQYFPSQNKIEELYIDYKKKQEILEIDIRQLQQEMKQQKKIQQKVLNE